MQTRSESSRIELPDGQRGNPSTRNGWARSRALVVLAVGYQWFYNGANFVAFKIGGDAIHPLLLATLRFAIAAVVILPLGLLRLRAHPSRARECINAAGLGVVMLVGSQTTAILGTHMLPAGVASVFGSAAPLFLALFAWVALRERIGWRQTCGIGLGFAGLVLMAWFTSGAGGFKPLGVALTLFASACWAGGSLWAQRLRLPADPVVALTAQLTAAAAVLVIVTASTGEPGLTDLTHLPTAAWWALGFLVVGSTLVGYAVFLAVNSVISPTIANTFNYASPVVALLLSAALLGEHLSFAKLFAAGVALSGVALMIRGGSKKQGFG